MTWLVLFLSLGVVVLGAEMLVRGASLLAIRAGVSPLFVGLTIVGFGTSSPELVASVTATLEGSSGVAVGNVIGSNIFNVGVIVGVTALIHPIRTRLRALRRDLMFAVAATALPGVALFFGGTLPRIVGGGFLLLLAVYLLLAYRVGRRGEPEQEELAQAELADTLKAPLATRRWIDSTAASVLAVALGLALLVGGSRFFVEAAIALARTIGLSEFVIGLTIVSAGTSLPELVTSVVAGARRNPDIAVGNIIGSNIFNVLGILGISTILRPQRLTPEALWIDIPVMVLACLALLPILRTGGVISRREGLALLAGYGVYLATLLTRGS